MNSNSAMYMQKISVKTVLQDSTAVADVQPTHTNSMEIYLMRMI